MTDPSVKSSDLDWIKKSNQKSIKYIVINIEKMCNPRAPQSGRKYRIYHWEYLNIYTHASLESKSSKSFINSSNTIHPSIHSTIHYCGLPNYLLFVFEWHLIWASLYSVHLYSGTTVHCCLMLTFYNFPVFR